ncbi:esterase-like activity of phytase family protein [Chitinophaga nivalis]|uniref:Esterase-like activity of phytase family protein n=1 Tax=Chitinophaga nivalis TaxID=2991709 RepID=A0ABT3ITW8_9BACT|nr:esterase-like activity of phytase family protein [Chitinophaga nivalis]MCW3463160.1 esterase-like activity of phytase family protein [Chitinophaga nivalis]MCW3487150.1 esterase-like activity of phytase family protein [Chitinophaga nivalis]
MKRKLLLPAIALLMLAISCKKEKEEMAPENASNNNTVVSGAVKRTATSLGAPVAEAKVYKLIPGYDKNEKFEASGVYYLDGFFYVVFDNRFKIAKIKSTLPINSSQNTLLGSGSGDSDFEGITYSNANPARFYVVEEAVQNGSNYQPRIREYDADMNYLSNKWVGYNFSSSNSNKGFEGIARVYRGGEDYILGLVEGTGKVPVLKKTNSKWEKIAEITLPASAAFSDYADIAVYGNKVAIVGQEDALLWVGTLSDTSWSFSGGTTYSFPTGNSQGVVGAGSNVLYGNVEGVSFISANQIVVVSDKVKSDQPSYQTYKDQSVHIFNLP